MKIGLLYPRLGAAGVWAPALSASAVLAAAEINAAGGVFGREVELVAVDCGASPSSAAAAVDDLLEMHGVAAIVGAHPSDLRDAISARLAGRTPYVYTAQYEGVRCGRATVAIGSVDAELLGPALAWLKERRRAERFYFVGDDYVWPRMARDAALACVRAQGGRFVGEAFLPPRGRREDRVIDEIAKSGADVVIGALLGQNAIDFHRAFARAGLDRKTLRFGLLIDETIICGIGAEATHNLFTAAHYFASRRQGANAVFLERYHEAFGEWAPPASAASVLFHQGVHFVATLAREGGAPPALARRLDRRISPRAARGFAGAKPLGRSPAVLVAAADGVQLDVVAEFVA